MKFDETVSNFDFGTRRDILKGNLTEMCQIYIGFGTRRDILKGNLTEMCQFSTLELEGIFQKEN